MRTADETANQAAVSLSLLLTVVLLGVVGPFATDMYVPGFPQAMRDLDASASQVQLTLTTFFVGMGVGQLVGGPISDQIGRKRPLVVGAVLVVLSSIACALAPTIQLLMIARFLQGFSGGWAMVIGRSVLVDLTHGPALVRLMNLVLGLGGLAPIIAPLIGATIQRVWNWRGAFWLVALLGVMMTVGALMAITESLPPERRHGGGLRTFAHAARIAAGRRLYVGYVMLAAFSNIGIFAYVATSSFVLQSMKGMSVTAYGVMFAVNACGLTLGTLTSARLAGRVPTRHVILGGLLVALGSAGAVLIGALAFGTPLPLLFVGFFCYVTAHGFIGANSGALAVAEMKDYAGTGSALLGLVASVAAAVAAPIAGLGGTGTAVPMALMMTLGSALALVSLLVVAVPHRQRPDALS